ADETREPTSLGDVQPSTGLPNSGELIYVDRMAHALDLELTELLEREVALDKRRRVPRHVGLTRLGELLHPLREPDRVADRGVVHREVLADRADHDLSRVDPDPDREAEPVVAAQLA